MDLFRNVELYEAVQKLNKEKEKFVDHLPFTTTPNFEHNFYSVFQRKHLEDKRNSLANQLSSHMSNVELYSEYKDRIKLLQRIGYVSAENTGNASHRDQYRSLTLCNFLK